MPGLRTAAVAACCLAAVIVPAHEASAAPRKFSNCTQLNQVYPHGVGKVGARDRTSSGRPVTTFTRNTKLYNANTARDRDKDGVACEKR